MEAASERTRQHAALPGTASSLRSYLLSHLLAYSLTYSLTDSLTYSLTYLPASMQHCRLGLPRAEDTR